MSYPVFKDLDKSVADLLNDDFDTKFTLKVKSAGPASTTLTQTTNYCPKSNALTPKVALKWAHPSGFTLDKLESTSEGKLSVETSLTGTAPGLKLEFKGNDNNKADLSFTYKVPSATVTGELDIVNFSSVKASVATGTGAVAVGASAEVKIAKSTVESTSFDLGASYTLPKQAFVAVKATGSLSSYSALVSYSALKDITLLGKVDYAKETTTATLGGVYSCNPNTTVKVKANTNGIVQASLKQVIDKSFSVVGSLEVPSQLNSVKFGVNATLG